MIIDVTLTILACHLALRSFKNYKMTRDTLKGNMMHLGWAGLFSGYAVTTIVYIVADLFSPDPNVRFIYLQIGYISAASGAMFFVTQIERVGFIRTKRVFTVVFAILYVMLLGFFVWFLVGHSQSIGTFIQLFSVSFWVPIIILFTIYMVKLNRLIRGRLRTYSAGLTIGIAILILGYIGATDKSIEIFGLWIRVLSDCLQAGGLLLISVFFSLLPSWREVDWRLALKDLFVIYQGGLSIYEHHFGAETGKDQQAQTVMVGSVLDMAQSFIQQMLQVGTLKVLDIQDKKIILEQGQYVLVAIVADQELDSIKYLLHSFVNRFETFFGDQLKNFQGDSSVFSPADKLLKQIFA